MIKFIRTMERTYDRSHQSLQDLDPLSLHSLLSYFTRYESTYNSLSTSITSSTTYFFISNRSFFRILRIISSFISMYRVIHSFILNLVRWQSKNIPHLTVFFLLLMLEIELLSTTQHSQRHIVAIRREQRPSLSL